MKKIFVFAAIFAAVLSSPNAYSQSNQTESLTITTYYLSPYGVYRNLKLNPTTTEPSGPALSAGVMYFDNNTNMKMIRYYNGTAWINVTESSSGSGETLIGALHTVGDCRTAGGHEFDSDTSLKLCKFSDSSGVTCPAGWTRYKDFTKTEPSSVTTTYTYTFCPKSCTAPGHPWLNQPPDACKVRQCYIPQECYSGCTGVTDSAYTGVPFTCWSFMSSACTDPFAIAKVTEIGCY